MLCGYVLPSFPFDISSGSSNSCRSHPAVSINRSGWLVSSVSWTLGISLEIARFVKVHYISRLFPLHFSQNMSLCLRLKKKPNLITVDALCSCKQFFSHVPDKDITQCNG